MPGLELGHSAAGVALPIYQQRQQPALLDQLRFEVCHATLHVSEVAANCAQMLKDQVLDVGGHAASLGGGPCLPQAGVRGSLHR
jgi:hypothetical protein